VGAHRATTPRWRWTLVVALPVAVLAGTGLALAELPDSVPAAVDAELSQQAPDGDAAGATSATPPESDVVTQAPESTSPEPSPSDETGEPEDEQPVDEMVALAGEAIRLTNEERQAAGCPTVSENPQLTDAATGHSGDMAANGYFDHTSQDGRDFVDRATAAGYNHAMSENIAMGYATAADVIAGWMNSPGHRDNLLNCDAVAIGLGVARSPDGSLLWTQMFGRA
jgi:uncharacterized protein YkwD